MRPPKCTLLTVLLLAIFAFLAGPASAEGGPTPFEEESERVEEVSPEGISVVRSVRARVSARVRMRVAAPPVQRIVRQLVEARVPRAPGHFVPPLRC